MVLALKTAFQMSACGAGPTGASGPPTWAPPISTVNLRLAATAGQFWKSGNRPRTGDAMSVDSRGATSTDTRSLPLVKPFGRAVQTIVCCRTFPLLYRNTSQ